MALKRCDNGHYFDPAKHSTCPSCGISDLQKTQPKRVDPVAPQPAPPPRPASADEGRTVPLERKRKGIDPVVGWLVCVEGAARGQDYRIRSERNYIGRGEGMDIRVEGDETISREKHASVSFNPKNQQFKLHPGEGRGLVYLNGTDIDAAVVLNKGDVIEMGQTKLMFMPLCSDTFTWGEG